jgi:dihydroflavonol-4-reductase
LKALVTGGTGFVGSHVVRALVEAGHTVRVLHRKTSKLDVLNGLTYESALGDILDTAALTTACAGCEWVFHVAAVADYWRADKKRMFEANVEGTRRVLRAAKSAGVRRVVFTSSAAAVGLRADSKPVDESIPFNLLPERFAYGYSKMLAEEVVQVAVAAGQDVVIVNPVIVMGPGDLNMISGTFVTLVKRLGLLVPVTPGGIAVIDVRDVARMHLAAAERGRTGERYILSAANCTQREWLGMIADVVGVRRPFLPVPGFILPLVANVVDVLWKFGIHTPVDSDQVRLGMKYIYFDGSKAWKELGKPQVEMRQSLRDTYAWYRERGII